MEINDTVIDNDTLINNTRLGFAGFAPEVFMAYNIFLYCSIALAVPGNMLVIFVYIKLKPVTSTDWFIIFISIVDFTSSLINVPIYSTFTSGLWKHYGNDIICKLHMFTSQSMVLSSTFLICGLSLDRYFKVCQTNARRLSNKNALIVCLLICFITTLFSIPCFKLYRNSFGRCGTSGLGYDVLAYYVFVFLTFIVATVIVVFCYTKINIVLAKNEKNVQRNRESQGETSNRANRGWCCRKFAIFNKVSPDESQTHGRPWATSQSQTAITRATTSSSSETEISNVKMESSPNMSQTSGIIQTISVTKTESNRLQPPPPQYRPRQLNIKTTTKTTKIAFLVCSIFIVTWIPPWICFILAMVPSLRSNGTVMVFAMFGRMTYLINTFTNPILYTWLNRKFRAKVIELMCCCKKN